MDTLTGIIAIMLPFVLLYYMVQTAADRPSAYDNARKAEVEELNEWLSNQPAVQHHD